MKNPDQNIVEDGQLDYDDEGEFEPDFSGEEIMDYIKDTDTIILASGEVIKNNDRFTLEELADLIK